MLHNLRRLLPVVPQKKQDLLFEILGQMVVLLLLLVIVPQRYLGKVVFSPESLLLVASNLWVFLQNEYSDFLGEEQRGILPRTLVGNFLQQRL